MVYSIIKKTELEGSARLDAEYYQPEYLKIDSKILAINHKTLKNYAEKIFSGPFGSTLKSESYQESGIPFIRIADISDLVISKDSLVYISPEEHQRIHSTYLGKDDIVLSKIGTIGRFSVISEDLGEVNISENNIGIRLSSLKIEEKKYLLFFLLSKYGQSQLIRKASGNVQLKLNVSDIESLQIPVFSNDFVLSLNNSYNEFILKTNDYLSLYSQAENLLLDELGLNNFKNNRKVWSIVNFRDVFEDRRMDAEYFNSDFEIVRKKLEKQKIEKLGDLVTIKKGIEPGSDAYKEEGKLFIRVSSLSKDGVTDKDQKYLSENLFDELRDQFEPKVGEILLTKDATPGIAYVLKEPIEGIISGGILRLKAKEDIDQEYIALCINSIIGQSQVSRDAGGSVIAHWKPEQVKNLVIPILSKDKQEKIADLVKRSHEAKKKAKELLEEAKRKVEEEIEK